MTDRRECLIAIGRFMGVITDGVMAQRTIERLSQEEADLWLESAVKIFRRHARRDRSGEMLGLLCDLDVSEVEATGEDRRETLARHIFDRAKALNQGSVDPIFDSFYSDILECLRRIETSLTGALYIMGVRQEVICLKNPLALHTIEELEHLPCRRYQDGAGAAGSARSSSAAARYVRTLMEGYGKKHLSYDSFDKIMDALDRLSIYPGYLRMITAEHKAAIARHTVMAIQKLRRIQDPSQWRDDLVLALGMLLYSVYPTQHLATFLADLHSGHYNRYLQHEYYATMALSSLLAGETARAASYSEKTYHAAPEPDMKIYSRMLSGCIHMQNHEYVEAKKDFEGCLRISDGRIGSIIRFYMGILHYELGETKLALDHFTEVRSDTEADDDIMTLCNNIGTCHMAKGDLGTALKNFDEAESCFVYSGRSTARQLLSVACGNKGIIYLSMREHDLAIENFRKALRISRETGNHKGIANQLGNIGLIYKSKKEYARAASYFASAMNFSCSIDYLEGVIYFQEQLRQALALDGRHGDVKAVEREVIRRHPGFASMLSSGRER
ncbi:MAG TPA: tetratricopeptide repeat protein [Methanocella sp.]|nr:tetratricopeptide repeat protein [Methanocella sp.]